MFEIWRLDRRRRVALKTMKAKLKHVDPKTEEGHKEIVERCFEYSREVMRVQDLAEMHVSQKLCDEARALDVAYPPTNEEAMWRSVDTTPAGDDIVLTPKGRSAVRMLIDAEKARRFEVKTLWVTKFWLPLLAALIGIIGSITGLVAVLHQRYK